MNLKYGSRHIAIHFPEQADILCAQEPEIRISPARFRERLEGALGRLNPRLARVAIVVADKTRLCGYPAFLPVLIKALESRGAQTDQIICYIAYGTHARQTESECLTAYGDIYKQYRFVHHDCEDKNKFEQLAETSRGTPVCFRRDVMEATCLITFGAVNHHYFAGYGGGRKLLFPGLGLRKAIYQNHGLFLDACQGRLASLCRSGRLDGNPLAEDLAEVESFRPADLAVHGIINSDGQVCNLLVGRGDDVFKRACREHGKTSEIATARQYDCVIASCGGYPKDINFIQSHKAVNNAAEFVRDGGTLIVLAECRDGIGSKTFLPWFELGGWDQAFMKLSRNYEGNGGTALAMMAKTRRIRILLVTELDGATCRRMGVQKIPPARLKEYVEPGSQSMAVIPKAGVLVKR